MSKSAKRPDFLKTMGSQVNDKRFCLSDRYDKSTYLTKVSRPKAIVHFEKESKRPEDLIAKGGDLQVRLDGKSQVFYDHDVKDQKIMKRMNAGIAEMNKQTARTNPFGNMYIQEDDITPDHYDSVKIAEKANKIKPRTKPYVDMKK